LSKIHPLVAEISNKTNVCGVTGGKWWRRRKKVVEEEEKKVISQIIMPLSWPILQVKTFQIFS
jgi:hypothetical protein